MQSVGEKIKAAREAAGRTQEQLGKRLGVTGVAVMRYEKGQRQPSINQRLLMADIFKTSLLYFIEQDVFEEEEIVVSHTPTKPLKERLEDAFQSLTDDGQQKAVERVEELTEIPKYQREKPQDMPTTPTDGKDAPQSESPSEGPQEGK